jgi:beta-lactamase class A
MKRNLLPWAALAVLALLIAPCSPGQTRELVADSLLTTRLMSIVRELGLDGTFDVGEDGTEQISLAVVDLSSGTPRLAGVNERNFIYPASVYKMYVAAEVLEQISRGRYTLWTPVVVRFPNAVDVSVDLPNDPRRVLREGDTVTVNYLLDLMITRSDNSAANCLIDLAGRTAINAFIAHQGWQGSEVTRKFLKRTYEDPGYEHVKGTETCALHAAEFMVRIWRDSLINSWVSGQMRSYLARQLDTSKLAAGLPGGALFYHKTGWFSYWTNDVGIVHEGSLTYVVACFLPIREELARPKMKVLSARIHALVSHP